MVYHYIVVVLFSLTFSATGEKNYGDMVYCCSNALQFYTKNDVTKKTYK